MAKVENFHISNFMSTLRDGARPNQFQCNLTLPRDLSGQIIGGNEAENKFKFGCKSTALPQSSIGEVLVPFRGHNFKLAGDRTFQDWNVTIINDNDFLLRDMFESWSDWVVGHVEHDQAGDSMSPLNYMGNGDVSQLTRNGEIIKTYSMVGVWPADVAEIPLDHGTNDQVEEFSVTFKIQWWESSTTRNNTENQKVEDQGGFPVI